MRQRRLARSRILGDIYLKRELYISEQTARFLIAWLLSQLYSLNMQHFT